MTKNKSCCSCRHSYYLDPKIRCGIGMPVIRLQDVTMRDARKCPFYEYEPGSDEDENK